MNRIWSTYFRTTFSDGIGACRSAIVSWRRSKRDVRDKHPDCMQDRKQAMVILRMRSR